MNQWMCATLALCLGLVPCGWHTLRADDPFDRLVSLEMASILATFAMLTLAEAMKRAIFFDLAMMQALLSFGGGLVFARYLERWL